MFREILSNYLFKFNFGINRNSYQNNNEEDKFENEEEEEADIHGRIIDGASALTADELLDVEAIEAYSKEINTDLINDDWNIEEALVGEPKESATDE